MRISGTFSTPFVTGIPSRDPSGHQERPFPSTLDSLDLRPSKVGFKRRKIPEAIQKSLPVAGAVVGGLAGSVLGSALNATGAVVGGALGATVGMMTGQAYTIPDHLFHFTSEENAHRIVQEGKLEMRPGNHGAAVYTTRFDEPLVATLQRAAHTDMRFKIPTEDLEIKRTFIPGTFKVVQDIDVKSMELQKVEPGPITEFLQEHNFRDLVNPNA